ncbi:hypothetical protein CPB85DRAFT_598187 [Mucidula mucida]|nr:hypothetical protein CPB85DRAFT_598187 [Mucidula mucida]
MRHPESFHHSQSRTSQRLKENRFEPVKKTYGKYGKTKTAAMLETSYESSPDQDGYFATSRTTQAIKEPLILGGPLGPLSTLPLASAPSSPNQRSSVRRPSFDAPHTHLYFDLFSPSRNVDFNRPPSQLSLYDFDADLSKLFQSTPKRTGYDTESDEEDAMQSIFRAKLEGGYETPDMDDSDWVSESLISPPSKKQAHNDVEMLPPSDPQVLEELLDSLVLMPSSPQRSRSLDSGSKDKDSILDSDNTSTLAPALPINRTRSGTVIGRARSGTIKSAATLAIGNIIRGPPPTRTRSGTIVPSTTRARSGSIVASQPVAGSRARSGSIVALPGNPSTRTRSGSIIAPSRIMGPPPPPPSRPRNGSIIAPPSRNRSASIIAPPGRTRSGSIVAHRSGSVAASRPTALQTLPPSIIHAEEEDSPDELDLIMLEEPIVPPPIRSKARASKIEKARKQALKRSKGDDDMLGEIGDDETLL